ncbi:MAG: hypothetical protein HBSAPP04_10450 [Ignavibacteriaceae bacterium]|nr:MAG: ferrous iron transporter B [Chlorobiota bacterium]GJQ32206.1 MAG: hypothetical protein HBSAPP04_10450 [Ignavibacteriaceae bacterium]
MRTENTGIKLSPEDLLQNKQFTPAITDRKRVVLVGNPNVGKSLVFNHLSGLYADVSNFPGTTVSVSRGTFGNYDILDTPGIYGVSSFNDEERVARDVIVEADIILNIVNSLHLERDLFLTKQLIEMGKKVSIILNFSDEVKRKKIKIDAERLSALFGVEVIETSAISGNGFDLLPEAIAKARTGFVSGEITGRLNQHIVNNHGRGVALLVAEGDEEVSSKFGYEPGTADDRETIYIERRKTVNEIISEVEYEDTSKGRFFNKLGSYSLNPVTGIPILAFMLVVLYYLIGDVVAQQVVGFTEDVVGKKYFEFYTKKTVSEFAAVDITVAQLDADGNQVTSNTFNFKDGLRYNQPQKLAFEQAASDKDSDVTFDFKNPIVRLFFGEFGVFSMTITYLLFLLLPLVIAFYFVMAMLEDSGYLPRLATMMDRSLSRIGLNGRAIIPILLGFGCVTMATITTRILGTEREKTIATAILQFVIPCSAQLAVIAVLAGTAGPTATIVYGSVIVAMMITVSTVLHKMLPGQSSPLLIDLPMMRIPRIDNILKKTWHRTVGFMKEASVWFFVGALAVGLMEITGLLQVFTGFLEPLTVNWLKLPSEASVAFVMGTVRRDFGGAGLYDLALSPMQVAVSLIVITLFVPCIASFMVMLKERGWKEGFAIWLSAWVIAFLVGGLTAMVVI